MTSRKWRHWLMSLKPKRTALSDIGCIWCTVSIFVCEARGYSVRYWVGVWHRNTETLLKQGTFPYSLDYGSTTPGLWSFFVINKNYLMLLRMRCSIVYFRSGSPAFTYPWYKFSQQQTHQKLHTRWTRQFEIHWSAWIHANVVSVFLC